MYLNEKKNIYGVLTKIKQESTNCMLLTILVSGGTHTCLVCDSGMGRKEDIKTLLLKEVATLKYWHLSGGQA
jgi:hypothetical protein